MNKGDVLHGITSNEGFDADEIIIDELDITIPKGEISVFIGGNGCGKSTLLRSLARLLKTMFF